jgi:ABC-type transporter MlaC component
MALTQRSEFASVVGRNGVDGLIEVLRARAAKLSAPVTRS